MTPDATDLQILKLLQADAKMSTRALAEKLNLSTSPVFERVKRLEKNGFIDRYVAILKEHKLGMKQTVFIAVSLKNHTRSYLERFQEEINSFTEVQECYHIAGDFDYLLKVLVKDNDAYRNFLLTKLSVITNISHVQSHIALARNKCTTELDLSAL